MYRRWLAYLYMCDRLLCIWFRVMRIRDTIFWSPRKSRDVIINLPFVVHPQSDGAKFNDTGRLYWFLFRNLRCDQRSSCDLRTRLVRVHDRRLSRLVIKSLTRVTTPLLLHLPCNHGNALSHNILRVIIVVFASTSARRCGERVAQKTIIRGRRSLRRVSNGHPEVPSVPNFTRSDRSRPGLCR